MGLFDLATRLPAVVMDAPVILRGALTGLLALPTSKTSIGTVFQDRAARFGERVFIRFGDEKITYRQANETANRYAAVLTDHGVRRGNVVGIMLRNSPDAVLMMLAAVKCGAVAGMLNYNQRGEVLGHSLGLLNATVVVAESDLVEPIVESGAEVADLLTVENVAKIALGKHGSGTPSAGRARTWPPPRSRRRWAPSPASRSARCSASRCPTPAAGPGWPQSNCSLETTSTFKSRKVELRNQAYGPDVADPLYVLCGREEGYLPFYDGYAEEVAAGRRP